MGRCIAIHVYIPNWVQCLRNHLHISLNQNHFQLFSVSKLFQSKKFFVHYMQEEGAVARFFSNTQLRAWSSCTVYWPSVCISHVYISSLNASFRLKTFSRFWNNQSRFLFQSISFPFKYNQVLSLFLVRNSRFVLAVKVITDSCHSNQDQNDCQGNQDGCSNHTTCTQRIKKRREGKTGTMPCRRLTTTTACCTSKVKPVTKAGKWKMELGQNLPLWLSSGSADAVRYEESGIN